MNLSEINRLTSQKTNQSPFLFTSGPQGRVLIPVIVVPTAKLPLKISKTINLNSVSSSEIHITSAIKTSWEYSNSLIVKFRQSSMRGHSQYGV